MRTLAFLAFVLVALPVSTPAEARIAGKPESRPEPRADPFVGSSRPRGPGVRREIGDIHDRLDRARRSGAISHREARRLRREARRIDHLARRYGRDGLSASERIELDARAAYLRDAINRPRSGGGGRR